MTLPVPDVHDPKAPRVVTPRTNPDLDGVACAIAYAELLRQLGLDAIPHVSGRPDAEARFVISQVGWNPPVMPPGPFLIILVDASDVLGLPEVVQPEIVVEVIDHRVPHQAEVLFPEAKVQVEAVGAAATLVEERFVQADVRPSRTSAILLQAAILSNTQRLRGSVTTLRDAEAVARLREVHPLDDAFLEGQFGARGAEIRADLLAAVLRETKTYVTAWGRIRFSQLECLAADSLLEKAIFALGMLGPAYVLNLVDSDAATSTFLVPDESLRSWLGETTGLVFVDRVSRTAPALLRKQILALVLKEES